MKNIWIIFDGSNFYHYLKKLPKQFNPSKFDYKKFVKYLAKKDKILKILYCIGRVRTEKNNPKSFQLMKDQHRFLSKLKNFGFEIFLGYILKKNGYHEKGVDVKIAVEIIKGAYYKEYDILYLISSDTDLIPSIQEAIKLKRKIIYVGFSKNPSFALIKNCSDSLLLDQERLQDFF